MFFASDAREVYSAAFYHTCRAGLVGHSIARDFPLKYLKKDYRPKHSMHVDTFLRFHAEGGVWTLVNHCPWLNTAIFLLGDNDFDNIDTTIRHHRDITFAIMHTGRILMTYGIRTFFIPLQNRTRPRLDTYDEVRTLINKQLATHF